MSFFIGEFLICCHLHWKNSVIYLALFCLPWECGYGRGNRINVLHLQLQSSVGIIMCLFTAVIRCTVDPADWICSGVHGAWACLSWTGRPIIVWCLSPRMHGFTFCMWCCLQEVYYGHTFFPALFCKSIQVAYSRGRYYGREIKSCVIRKSA